MSRDAVEAPADQDERGNPAGRTSRTGSTSLYRHHRYPDARSLRMSSSAQIGVTGLAVMGRNLARNFARNGYTVAVHNRTASKTRELVEEFGHEGSFVPAETAEDFVAALE